MLFVQSSQYKSVSANPIKFVFPKNNRIFATSGDLTALRMELTIINNNQ